MSARRKPQPIPQSLAELSRQTGITRETLRKWKNDGVDIQEPDQLAARIEVMRSNAEPGSLTDAKLRKCILECERIQFALEREQGKFYLASEVDALFNHADHAVSTVWKNLGRELPALLDGVPTSGMEKVIHGFVDDILIPRFRQLLESGKQNLKTDEA